MSAMKPGSRFDAGLDDEAAADDIDIADFRDWGDPERLAANVANLYREFDHDLPPLSPPELFVKMARWSARHGSRYGGLNERTRRGE